MIGQSMIGMADADDASRIDAATLPKFWSRPYLSCRRVLAGGRVCYCPVCPKIRGPHFHIECRCGATWDER